MMRTPQPDDKKLAEAERLFAELRALTPPPDTNTDTDTNINSTGNHSGVTRAVVVADGFGESAGGRAAILPVFTTDTRSALAAMPDTANAPLPGWSRVAQFPTISTALRTDKDGNLLLTLTISAEHKYDALPITDFPGEALVLTAHAVPRDALKDTSIDELLAMDWSQ